MEEEKIFQEIELCWSTMGAMCRLPSTPLDKSRQRERKLLSCAEEKKWESKDNNNEPFFLVKTFAFELSRDLLKDWSFIVDGGKQTRIVKTSKREWLKREI